MTFNITSKFNGAFNDTCEQDAVSSILVSFIQVLLQGSNIDDKVTKNTRRSALTIAQMIHFNAVK